MSHQAVKWPFRIWLRLAVIRYGFTPQEFWEISVFDWLTLVAPAEINGVRMVDLSELIKKYPDQELKNE